MSTWGPPSQVEWDETLDRLGKIIGQEAVDLIERLIQLALDERDYRDPDDPT